MSNNTNTQLNEELADLEEEFKEEERRLTTAENEVKDALEWLKIREGYFEQAKVALENLKERMKHD